MSLVADEPNVDTTTAAINDTCIAPKKTGPNWGLIIIASILCVIVMNLKTIVRFCKTLAVQIKCAFQPNKPNANAMSIVETNVCNALDHLSENTDTQVIDEHSYYGSMFAHEEQMQTQVHKAYDPIIEEETSSSTKEHKHRAQDNIQVQERPDTPEETLQDVQEGTLDDTPENASDVPENVPENVPEDVPEDVPEPQVQAELTVAPKKRQSRKKKEPLM